MRFPFFHVRGVALMIVMTCCVFLFSTNVVEGVIGINWGRMTTNRLIPSMVVDLLLQNEIREVRLFSTSKNVLEAFSRSGIDVTITIPNQNLKGMLDPKAVRRWINQRIISFIREEVDIRYLVHRYFFSSSILKCNFFRILNHFWELLQVYLCRDGSILKSIQQFNLLLCI